MSAHRSATQSRRTTALVLGYLGLVPLGLIWIVFLLIMTLSEGASQMAAAAPMLAYLVTGWLWALLAVIALVLTADLERPLHPRLVAGVALLAAFLGLFALIPR